MSSVAKAQTQNRKQALRWVERWLLLLSAGAIVSVCFLEIKRRNIAVETASILSEIESSKAAPVSATDEPSALQAQLERLQNRLETLSTQESIARAARNAKAEEESRLRKTLQSIEAGLSVVPETAEVFSARIARALTVCADARVKAVRNVESGGAGPEAEARLVLVRSVGALRRMERDLPKFSEFMTAVVAQFYGLGEDARNGVQKVIHSGFEEMRLVALSSLDRPEPGSDRWEIRSLDWEAARDQQIERIAQSLRSIIPETHPYSPWLPSVLSMSSGLRGVVDISDGNPAKKTAITVTLPLCPVKN